jgi:hypothetical protein
VSCVAYDDDDDWVGTPPEGHITRDRADPGFWANNWKFTAVSSLVFVVLILVAVLLLLTQ